MDKFTKKDGVEHERKIIACNAKFQRDIRMLLIEAFERKLHEAFGLEFEPYLKKLSQKTTSLSVKHMRRITNAGLIERELLGKDNIGKMSGAALRVLNENVKPEHRKDVYELAFKTNTTKKPYPSAPQIIEAAEGLGVYKQRPSGKEKNKDEQLNNKNGNKKVVSLDKGKIDKAKELKHKDKSIKSKILKTSKKSKLSAIIKGQKLAKRLDKNDAGAIANILKEEINEKVLKECRIICKKYPIEEWAEIVAGINRALKPKKNKVRTDSVKVIEMRKPSRQIC